MTAHKHAALMLQYAEDAAKTDKPWELWECRVFGSDKWNGYDGGHPSWKPNYEYRRKPVKWQPVGGEWLVNISGETFEITSSKHSKELALERPTKEQAQRAAVEMRRFNRLLALRDELCGDEVVDCNEQQYEVAINNEGKYFPAYPSSCLPYIIFTTKESAQRACDMLNSGEVEL